MTGTSICADAGNSLSPHSKKGRTLKRFDFAYTRSSSEDGVLATNGNVVPPELSLGRQDIERLNQGDMAFFEAARLQEQLQGERVKDIIAINKQVQ